MSEDPSHTVGAMSTQIDRTTLPTQAAPTPRTTSPTPAAPTAPRPTAPVSASNVRPSNGELMDRKVVAELLADTEARRLENERKRQEAAQAARVARPGEQRPSEPGTQVRDAVTGQMINQPASIDAVTGHGRT